MSVGAACVPPARIPGGVLFPDRQGVGDTESYRLSQRPAGDAFPGFPGSKGTP